MEVEVQQDNTNPQQQQRKQSSRAPGKGRVRNAVALAIAAATSDRILNPPKRQHKRSNRNQVSPPPRRSGAALRRGAVKPRGLDRRGVPSYNRRPMEHEFTIGKMNRYKGNGVVHRRNQQYRGVRLSRRVSSKSPDVWVRDWRRSYSSPHPSASQYRNGNGNENGRRNMNRRISSRSRSRSMQFEVEIGGRGPRDRFHRNDDYHNSNNNNNMDNHRRAAGADDNYWHHNMDFDGNRNPREHEFHLNEWGKGKPYRRQGDNDRMKDRNYYPNQQEEGEYHSYESNEYERQSTVNHQRSVSMGSDGSSQSHDDTVGHYKGKKGDVMVDRYKIIGDVGLGTFGRVLECIDLKAGSGYNKKSKRNRVAIKVVRNIKRYIDSAKIEADIVRDVNAQRDPLNEQRGTELFAEMFSCFAFQEHFCLVFECLGQSLYDYIKRNDYEPFRVDETRHISQQLLSALDFLHSMTPAPLIHTDLKLENILLVNDKEITDSNGDISLENTKIKVIDFGG